MNAIQRVRQWWNKNDGMIVFAGTSITGIVTYFYYLILEPLNSDCFAEGFLKYRNDTWAIQLGKWMVPVYAKISGHIVSPIIYLVIYVLSVSISAMLLTDLWEINKKVYRVLIGALLMVAPAITGQIIYIYLFFAYAMSLLLSVLSSYIAIKTTGWPCLIGAATLMACALASYQPYIGDILVVMAGTLVLQVMQDDKNFKALLRVLTREMVFIVSGIIIYWVMMKLSIVIYATGETSYAGINNAGVLETLINIPRRIKHTYRIFWWYYMDSKLGGRIFWIILAGVTLVCIVGVIIRLISNKALWKVVIILFLLTVIPPSANFMYLVLPEHGIQLQMTYQMQLLGPLCVAIIMLALSEKHLWNRMIFFISTVGLVGLIVGYSYCAYSSFRTLDIGSRHIKLYIQNAITHAIEDGEYKEGMPIVFLGFVNDDPVQEKNPLREYSYFERAYPFWRDQYEVFSVWKEYCWYQYGIDIGNITTEQYARIKDSDDIKSMEQYPSYKSYAVIDGCYVILMDRESVQ